jgi:hypothetical protein
MPSGRETVTGTPRAGDPEGTDPARLQQQISDLKMENRRLRKENKELRKEIDRRKARTTP